MLILDLKEICEVDLYNYLIQTYLMRYVRSYTSSVDAVPSDSISLTWLDVYNTILLNHALTDTSLFTGEEKSLYNLVTIKIHKNITKLLIQKKMLIADSYEAHIQHLKRVFSYFRSTLMHNNLKVSDILSLNTNIELNEDFSAIFNYARTLSDNSTCNALSFLNAVIVKKFSYEAVSLNADLGKLSAKKSLLYITSAFNVFFKETALLKMQLGCQNIDSSFSNTISKEDNQKWTTLRSANVVFYSDIQGKDQNSIQPTVEEARTALFDELCLEENTVKSKKTAFSNFSALRESSAYKAIQPYVRDISLLYEKNHPVCIGRETELEQLLQILLKKNKNNAILVGEAGVGKTTMVDVLPYYFEHEKKLKGNLVLELKLSNFIGGTKYRGDLENRVTMLLENLRQLPCVLFVDEIHLLMSQNSDEHQMSIGQLLKPSLSDGTIAVIGATTNHEYRVIEKDKAFMRRFDKVQVQNLTEQQVAEVINGLIDNYSAYHGIPIPKEIVPEIQKIASRYLYYKNSPDRELDLLDKACVYCVRNKTALSVETIKQVLNQSMGKSVITERIPKNLQEELKKAVKGQDEAIEIVSKALNRYKLGVKIPNRPLGVFLFQGTTGVGKTELAKALSKIIYDDDIIRYDMSEYSETNSISKLLGASAGYVGYNSETALSEIVKRPYSVVLFDEIEKADKSVHNLFLQILDNGKCTDSTGKMIDFQNTFIIFTTNIQPEKKSSIGFGADIIEQKKFTLDSLSYAFSREFLNRLDAVIPFKSFDVVSDTVNEIMKKELTAYLGYYKEALGVTLTYKDELIEYLVRKSDVKIYGIRSLKRVISDYIEEPLLETLNVTLDDKLIDVSDEDIIISDLESEFVIV